MNYCSKSMDRVTNICLHIRVSNVKNISKKCSRSVLKIDDSNENRPFRCTVYRTGVLLRDTRVGVKLFFGVRRGLPAPKLFKCCSVSGRTHVDANAAPGIRYAVGQYNHSK